VRTEATETAQGGLRSLKSKAGELGQTVKQKAQAFGEGFREGWRGHKSSGTTLGSGGGALHDLSERLESGVRNGVESLHNGVKEFPSGIGGTGANYDKVSGQGIYVLKDEAGKVRYIGRGDVPTRLAKHKITAGKDVLKGRILWWNNLTKAQAKGLEQRLIDHYGGALRHNPDTRLLNEYRSYAPENPNAALYEAAATDDLFNETLRKIGL
jgi:hypothetical protein